MRGSRQVGWSTRWLGRPLARAMLLSLVLHLAIIMLIQPAPRSRPAEVMLQARLVVAEAAVARPSSQPKVKTDLTQSRSAAARMHPDAPPTPMATEEAAALTKPIALEPAVARPAPMSKLETDLTDSHSAVKPIHPDAPSTPLPAEEAAAPPTPKTDADADTEKPEQDEGAAAGQPREQVAVGSG